MITSSIIIAVLLIVAIVLMVLELFLLPGITVAGIAAALCYLGAVYYAFAYIGPLAGILSIAIAVVTTTILLVWVARSKAVDRISLHKNIDSVAPTMTDDSIVVGMEGVALSRINPMGKVRFGESIVEVKSLAEFIDEGTTVRVIAASRNEIVVEAKR